MAVSRHADTPRTGHDSYIRISYPIHHSRGRERIRRAAHNVKFHRTGAKQLHHPVVGDLTLAYEALELPADIGQRILVYTAEPNSPSDDALKLLATWCATTPNAESRAGAAR